MTWYQSDILPLLLFHLISTLNFQEFYQKSEYSVFKFKYRFVCKTFIGFQIFIFIVLNSNFLFKKENLENGKCQCYFTCKSNYWIQFNSDTQPHHITLNFIPLLHGKKSIFSSSLIVFCNFLSLHHSLIAC